MSSFSGNGTTLVFSFFGATATLVFSCIGAEYEMAKSGVGVVSMGMMQMELVMKLIMPVVITGVLGIYRLIIAMIISIGKNPNAKSYYLFDGFAHLLSFGLASKIVGLFTGMTIGIIGNARV